MTETCAQKRRRVWGEVEGTKFERFWKFNMGLAVPQVRTTVGYCGEHLHRQNLSLPNQGQELNLWGLFRHQGHAQPHAVPETLRSLGLASFWGSCQGARPFFPINLLWPQNDEYRRFATETSSPWLHVWMHKTRAPEKVQTINNSALYQCKTK